MDRPSKKIGRPKGSKAKTGWSCSAGHIHKVGERCEETGESSQYLITRIHSKPFITRGKIKE